MIEIAKYKERYFAVYLDGDLLAVCVYRKGAYAIKGFITTLEAQVAHLQAVQAHVATAESRPCENH